MINLIGISGWIGSGKDTFAKMIQLAITAQRVNPFSSTESFENYWKSKLNTSFDNDWEIKKFATPLKQIACILLGCTMEQLEDQEFKKSYLPECWSNVSYAWGKPDGSDPNYTEKHERKFTVREFLQKLGTEAIRDQVHDNAWVNAMFSNYLPLTQSDRGGYEYPSWIITDLRFPNEAKAIKDRGGICIRMHREEGLFNPPGLSKHESETALDNYEFDAYIQNTTTLGDLYGWAKGIVNQYKLS